MLVLALAMEQRATLLTDDNAMRLSATATGIPVLDPLVHGGFSLAPQGHMYREALQRVGED
jgi:predicted nucleic acid-binding protein